MVKYGGTTWLLGIVGLICLAAFLSLFSGLGRNADRQDRCQPGPDCAAAFWIPTIWIAKDLVIEKIFGGFPWCLAGYSQYKNIYFSNGLKSAASTWFLFWSSPSMSCFSGC